MESSCVITSDTVRSPSYPYGKAENKNSDIYAQISANNALTDQQILVSPPSSGKGRSPVESVNTTIPPHLRRVLQPELSVEVFVKVLTRLTGSKEWLFLEDLHALIDTCFKVSSGNINWSDRTDLCWLSLLYVVTASMARRGMVRDIVSKSTGRDPEKVRNDLLDMHTELIERHIGPERTPEQSLIVVRALMYRSVYYVYSDSQKEQAWRTLYLAIAEMNSIPQPPPSNRELQTMHETTWLALASFEAGVCLMTDRKGMLYQRRPMNKAYEDPYLQRKWLVTTLSHRVQDTLAMGLDTTEVEKDIRDAIGYIDYHEGTLRPCGQVFLYNFLIKLHTQKLLQVTCSNKDTVLQHLIHDAGKFLECLEKLHRVSLGSLLGSVPFLSKPTFHGFACVHILSIYYPGLEELSNALMRIADSIVPEVEICHQTRIVVKGLEILKQAKKSNDARSVEIPLQLRPGMSSILQSWDSYQASLNALSAPKDSSVAVMFDPMADQGSFWAYLSSEAGLENAIFQ